MSEWKNIGIEYPPFNKPVLVTDGIHFQIRTLKQDKNSKYWSTDHNNDLPYIAQYWMHLPEPPKD